MRGILCTRLGGPEDLELAELPVPEPGQGEIRIRVHAAGVNFPDGLMIGGRYQTSLPLPFVPGVEFAGIIDRLGSGVKGVRVGDAVVASPGHGAFAELVVIPAETATRLAPSVSLDEAAGFSSAFGTTHHAYRQRAQLRPGDAVLVLGAGGGCGLAAVQMGKLLGAEVIAAASSAAKLALARESGADHLINYRTENLREQLNAITGGRGVDVVYDPVGGKLSEQAFRSLAWNGRHLVIGFAAGVVPALPLNLALLKGAAAVGVFYGAFMENEPDLHRENLRELFGWLADGKLRTHVGARFPLESAGEAIRQVMDGKALGKTIVTMTRA